MVQAAVISLVQFSSTADYFALQNDTEVKVVYAYHATNDAVGGIANKHTKRRILGGKHNVILLAMSAKQPSSTVSGIHPSQTVMPPTSSKLPTKTPSSFAVLSSPDGFFKLQWTYKNSKLIFKMTCKTTGWCAVGFTTTADEKNMVKYDIAVGGFASGAGYIDVSK